MTDPKQITEVVLDGRHLSLEQLVSVARYQAKVTISASAIKVMEESRAYVEEIARQDQVVYGVTTGFGDFSTISIPEDQSNRLSNNLILSHCVATGDVFSIEVVRSMILLRANALCAGVSGVRPLLVSKLCELLNHNVTPVIPEKGSLGASGDLASLSHMGLVLLGKGEAFYQGKRLPGKEALKLAGIEPLETLVSKEGLGITNGTCAMTGVGALALWDALNACQLADLIASLSATALIAQLDAFDQKVHQVRGQQGQILVARNLRKITAGCEILAKCQGERVQDAYALRCIPQVHGAIRDALSYVKKIVEIELNAVTDNPLVFPDQHQVISGGNFHGEPLALALDFLGIAVSELANISERRTERMVNAALSNGLPRFLAIKGGINSGFMIVQYSAASMVSENKVLAHPASVDSIPSSANQEDFVSMGTTAARKARDIMQNVLSVLAFELFTACQAIDIRRRIGKHGTHLSAVQTAIHNLVREKIPFLAEDQEMWPYIQAIEDLVRSGKVLSAAREVLPELE